MYWVLTKDTEETVAISKFKQVAEIVAKNYLKECIVRYA
jgi:hypothetical protein